MAEPNGTPHLDVEMQSQARLLAPVRTLVHSFAHRIGFDEPRCGQISLAIDEALCNIINHGYDRRPDGRIRLRLWDGESTPPSLHVVIEDDAKQVDPASIRSRDLDDIRPGGLGVYIIKEIMDEVDYRPRDGGGMRLTMFKQMSDGTCAEVSDASPSGQGKT